MTPTLDRYYENMKTENVKKQLDFLAQQMNEATEQWKLHCQFYKAGFDKLPSWEQESAEKNCEERRQFWFMQKEIAYKNWNEFSLMLDKKNFWANL